MPFALYNVELETLVPCARAIDSLVPGNKVLMAEICTHHLMKDYIGTVKIPRGMRQSVGGELDFHWSSGTRFPDNLSDYKLIVHCGACMINRQEMLSRVMRAQAVNVPIVNYGECIAYLIGILPRALSPFPEFK